MSRRALSLFAVIAGVMGCGARSSLEAEDDVGSAGGADVGPKPSGCPRVDDATLEMAGTVQFVGNIASNGCSFAATWSQNQAGGVVVVGATFRPVDGQWRASPVVTLGPGGGSNNSPDIVWDGTDYVVAWADERLVVQRMAEDGALVGPNVMSFEAPGNVYVRWLSVAPDGSLRVGFVSDYEGDGYQIYFARAGLDGTVALAPKPVTSAANVDLVGFTETPIGSEVYWTERTDAGASVLATTLDEEGEPVNVPERLLDADNFFASRHGVVGFEGVTYFGVLRYSEPRGLVIGQRSPGGYEPVAGAAGGDVPVLAFTGGGALGVLSRTNRQDPYADIALSIAEDGTFTSTSVVGSDTGSYSYAMAASAEAFGIFHATSGGAVFTTKTP